MSFRYLTAGESHGKGLMGILEGIPSGLPISTEGIHEQLKRRKLGYGRGARQKIETDEVEIITGARFGKTLGSPIGLLIWNRDWQSWQDIMKVDAQEASDTQVQKVRREVHVPRPGHADLVGGVKYNHSDMRNVLERSSARETAMRVALGSVARCFLATLGVSLGSRVVRIESVTDQSHWDLPVEELNAIADKSPVRCTDPNIELQMIAKIDEAKKQGDTLGGEFEVLASALPVGLGSYAQWDRRLEGAIAKSILSLNAIQGVEVGLGFKSAALPGSQVHDEIFPGRKRGNVRFKTNHCGGIQGGMSTGQTLVVRAAMKPLSTLMNPLHSVDLRTGEPTNAHIERSDVCAVPSAAVIGESLLCLVLAEAILEKFGGDTMEEVSQRVNEWRGICPID
jgi:chorismate synthase